MNTLIFINGMENRLQTEKLHPFIKKRFAPRFLFLRCACVLVFTCGWMGGGVEMRDRDLLFFPKLSADGLLA